MANELIINASLPETRIALMENAEIQELLIERASGKGIVGNIYKGRVTRVLPGMQAAFVDIGLEKAAFLYVDDVYVHAEIWKDEEEEGSASTDNPLAEVHAVENESPTSEAPSEGSTLGPIIRMKSSSAEAPNTEGESPLADSEAPEVESLSAEELESPAEGEDRTTDESKSTDGSEWSDEISDFSDDEDDEEDDENQGPAQMGPDDSDSGKAANQPEGTVAPESTQGKKSKASSHKEESAESAELAPLNESSDAESSDEEGSSGPEEGAGGTQEGRSKRHRRGRRGGRYRRKEKGAAKADPAPAQVQTQYPENYHEQLADEGSSDSDRLALEEGVGVVVATPVVEGGEAGRPEQTTSRETSADRRPSAPSADRSEFKAQRSRDRRIRAKASLRPAKPQINIQDLLKEGQEVLVQVAKDPIATKGARLTCHISLPGRHLVCMPTIDHVGVSRRIEREDERRRLREYVERNRPRNLGFIVRTASGKQQSEKRIKQDIEYLTRLWTEIREKAASVTAPALVYEDLNAVLRAVRDWVTEEIDKVIVDSRYHYNEILRFVSHFMPSLKHKVELYHGDIPIFDAYGISTELSRALERKVWLKSGGYIVIDQAEALVAIDVNTGRYVGKKNLEDTILKTNLEAVEEVAYQLRLRNCGGIIIIDLIDMEKDENKQRVYRALEEALSKDRARPSILKISELGLIEMTRKRTRDTIVRTLCESCSHCEGKGFIKGKQTVAYEVMREVEREGIDRDVNKVLVQAHPDVIDILAIDERESLDLLERRYRKTIYLQAIADFHPEQFEVSADKRPRPERGRDFSSRESSTSDRNRSRVPKPIPQPLAAQPNQPGLSSSSTTKRVGEKTIIEPRSTSRPELGERGGLGSGEGLAAASQQQLQDSSDDFQIEPGNAIQNRPSSESLSGPPGNVASGSMAAGNMNPGNGERGNTATSSGTGSDEFFDEEDRLAFLRAQAAQDAALARLSNGSHTSVRTHDSSNRGDRNTPNRRGARGRRGTKFRRGNDRGVRGPGQPAGPAGPHGKQFGGGGFAKPNQKWTEGSKDSNAAPAQAESAADNNTKTENNSGGNQNGGDQSQPPV
jgi:ribonuclease G